MNSSVALRGLIFDLDGTLADTLPVCFAAFRAAFTRYVPERTFTDAEIEAYFGPNEEGVIRQVVPQTHWIDARATYQAEYERVHDVCSEPFPGLIEVLDFLKENGVPVAVVTGKGAETAVISLNRLGLADRFDLVEAGSPERMIKPEAIRRVLDAWGLASEAHGSVAYIGDAATDIPAAREVGLIPLAAAWAPATNVAALEKMQPAELFRTVAAFDAWVRAHVSTGTENVPRWLRWARQMQAIAQNGLAYAKDPFDKERYEALRELSVEVVSHYAGIETGNVRELFATGTGYTTPKLDCRGVVFRTSASGEPELLLVQEKSDGGWTLPGGWVGVGEAPSEAIEKEVREEAGLTVKASKVLAMLDRDKHGHPPMAVHVWKIFIRCEIVGEEGSLFESGDGLETDGARFFPEAEAVALPLSRTRVLPQQIRRMFAHYRQLDLPTDFD